jgi:hypothetical protein
VNKEQQEAALKLANYFLDPERGGLAGDPWVRDMSRIVIGQQPVECVTKIKPRIKWASAAWICSAGGIVWLAGSTPMQAYRNWLFGGRR